MGGSNVSTVCMVSSFNDLESNHTKQSSSAIVLNLRIRPDVLHPIPYQLFFMLDDSKYNLGCHVLLGIPVIGTGSIVFKIAKRCTCKVQENTLGQ